ncbi:hypothetical protein [Bradyrhizobium guangxiense]|uniref:hypothetical protein n=1 Tax=Bradyrhizobium guangxiense TaxID=1325115 RepID=UPI0010090E53|nr:hypothetical protein [Bradyrhizobium guangxiense]
MGEHDEKVKLLEEEIAQQIELVAELICQGRPALAAMRVLYALTGQLVWVDSHGHTVCKRIPPEPEGDPQCSLF